MLIGSHVRFLMSLHIMHDRIRNIFPSLWKKFKQLSRGHWMQQLNNKLYKIISFGKWLTFYLIEWLEFRFFPWTFRWQSKNPFLSWIVHLHYVFDIEANCSMSLEPKLKPKVGTWDVKWLFTYTHTNKTQEFNHKMNVIQTNLKVNMGMNVLFYR